MVCFVKIVMAILLSDRTVFALSERYKWLTFFSFLYSAHMTVCFFICISTKKKKMCINSSVSRAWLIECCVSLNVWSHGFRYDFMKNRYNVNVNRDTCYLVLFIMEYWLDGIAFHLSRSSFNKRDMIFICHFYRRLRKLSWTKR